jgi:hypothetical protein
MTNHDPILWAVLAHGSGLVIYIWPRQGETAKQNAQTPYESLGR